MWGKFETKSWENRQNPKWTGRVHETSLSNAQYWYQVSLTQQVAIDVYYKNLLVFRQLLLRPLTSDSVRNSHAREKICMRNLNTYFIEFERNGDLIREKAKKSKNLSIDNNCCGKNQFHLFFSCQQRLKKIIRVCLHLEFTLCKI